MERLWSKIDKQNPDECWPWIAGKTSHGYGSIYFDGKSRPAHRIVYELTYGPVPDGLVLDHTCHNLTGCYLGAGCPHRACCNPAHLEAVPQVVNFRRGDRATQPPPTHCPRGHEYTPENTRIRSNAEGRVVGRWCRACNRLRSAAIRAKAKCQ